MKRQHLFKFKLFSAIFDTEQSKDDVKCIIIDLTFIAFERFKMLLFHNTFYFNKL